MNDQESAKVLVICGPTASGKTALALELAKAYKGDLISADSRQVYQGLDIITGKDIPDGFVKKQITLSGWPKPVTVYTDGEITIWGLDVVSPREEWSAGLFQQYANKAIARIKSSKRLPILVGGTGLYLKSITQTLPLPGKSSDDALRKKLSKLSVSALQSHLKQIDKEKLRSMNQSDVNNPRRLIRAIEIAKGGTKLPGKKLTKYDTLVIGLTAPSSVLEKRLKARISKRLQEGALREVASLPQTFWSTRAASATGLLPLKQFIQGSLSNPELEEHWLIQERQYLKRQLTWFKKQPEVVWFETSKVDWHKAVVDRLNNWYSQSQ